MKRVLIVGAGLSGCVLARQLAEAGVASLVIDKEENIGGLCYSRRDEETGVDVHVHGPHIFNTSNERVWEYVQRFDRFYTCVHRVKASNARGVFSFPVNLHTINQFFGKRLSPHEARAFMDSVRDTRIERPQNGEETLLSLVGCELYEAFFKGYTLKQWGVSPAELPADVFLRLPFRLNYDDNYYNQRYQGFPMSGYTRWMTNMLDHELIAVQTGVAYEHGMKQEVEHVFYCGSPDAYYRYACGELGYRTVSFEAVRGTFSQQGCGCINYSDLSVPYTRTHEHNYFSPWEQHEKSFLMKEYSSECMRDGRPAYPKRMMQDLNVLAHYMDLLRQEERVSFIGRLGCYRYLDMQHCVLMSLEYADAWLAWKQGKLASMPLMAGAAIP